MQNVLQTKLVSAIPPEAIKDNTSSTTTAINCSGYGEAAFILQLGATDIALAALKVQESDDNSSYSDVTGLVFGTSADIAGTTSTLPSATDDNKIYVLKARLAGRKKWLKVVCTFGDGTTGGYASCLCILSAPQQLAHTAAGVGAGQVLSA